MGPVYLIIGKLFLSHLHVRAPTPTSMRMEIGEQPRRTHERNIARILRFRNLVAVERWGHNHRLLVSR
jgi:hypothetical protein